MKNIPKRFLALMVASVPGCIGLRVASMTSISANPSKDSSRQESVALAGGRGSGAGDHSLVGKTAATVTSALLPTPTPFSHPLVFPPVNTNGNISIGIDEACVQILDGPCTNMWTYGGTYPGETIRRPTGQRTNVTFMNALLE